MGNTGRKNSKGRFCQRQQRFPKEYRMRNSVLCQSTQSTFGRRRNTGQGPMQHPVQKGKWKGHISLYTGQQNATDLKLCFAHFCFPCNYLLKSKLDFANHILKKYSSRLLITKYANRYCTLSYLLPRKKWPLEISKAMRFTPASREKFCESIRTLQSFFFGIVMQHRFKDAGVIRMIQHMHLFDCQFVKKNILLF